jgi:hypothetical protein
MLYFCCMLCVLCAMWLLVITTLQPCCNHAWCYMLHAHAALHVMYWLCYACILCCELAVSARSWLCVRAHSDTLYIATIWRGGCTMCCNAHCICTACCGVHACSVLRLHACTAQVKSNVPTVWLCLSVMDELCCRANPPSICCKPCTLCMV